MVAVVVSLVTLLGCAFAFGKRSIIMAVLLTRSIFDPIFDLMKSGDTDVGLGASLNALVIGVAAAHFLDRPRELGSIIAPMWLPFLAACLFSVSVTPEPILALRFFLVQLSYCAMFAIPYSIVKSDADLYDCLVVIVLSSIVPSLYAFIELATGGGMTDDEGLRLKSTFSHPNIFAFYLTLQIAMALLLMRTKMVRVPALFRQFIGFYLPVLLILLALTKTRSAWLACGLILIVYSLRVDRRFLIYLFVVFLVFLFEPTLRDRLTDLEAGNVYEDYAKLNSYAWRQVLWQSAMEWVAQSPIFGHGLESFRYYSAQFFPLQHDESEVIDAHSVYVQVLFETGVTGLISFLWIFVVLLKRLIYGFTRDRVGITILITFAISYLVVCYSDNMQFYLSFNWYFWFTMGAVCAWLNVSRGAFSVPDPEVGRLSQV